MTQPGIEPRSPGPLVNTLLIKPMVQLYIEYEWYELLLAMIVESDQGAPFSEATTPRRREGRYSFPWIAPLYSWYVPYNAEC